MKIKLSTICAVVPVVLMLLGPFPTAYAGEGSSEGSYLAKAEGYTVKIRTSVKYPTLKDNKGSFSGAGFLIDAERGWMQAQKPG